MDLEYSVDGKNCVLSYDGTVKSAAGKAQDIPYWECFSQEIELIKQRSLAKASPEAIEFLDPLNPKAPNKVDASTMTQEEWKNRRRFSIGSSEASHVFGDSPYSGCTSEDCYRRKVGEEPFLLESDEERRTKEDLFDYGHLAEQYLHGWVMRRCPESRLVLDTNIYSPVDRPYMTVNLDGMLQLPDGSWVHLEFKTANFRAKEDYDNDSIPLHYKRQLIQCQHTLGVWVSYIVVMFGRDDVVVRRYERDLDAEMEQVRGIDDFWNNHVVPRIPPEPLGTPSHLFQAIRAYGLPADGSIPEMRLPADLSQNVQAIVAIESEMAALNKRKKVLDEQRKLHMIPIAQAMGAGTSARLDVQGTMYELSYKPRKATRSVDMERLEYEFYDVYRELVFCPTEGSRSVKIKEIKPKN